jgi:hypothetical protein
VRLHVPGVAGRLRRPLHPRATLASLDSRYESWLTVLRTIVFAGKEISEDDVRQVLEEVALEQKVVMGTIAQELLERGERSGLEQGLQQGVQQGLRQGLLTGIRLGLKLKFGLAGVALMTEIVQIEDVALLQTIGDAIELADTPDQVRAIYRGG